MPNNYNVWVIGLKYVPITITKSLFVTDTTNNNARMAPLWEGLSCASCPPSSTFLSDSRRHRHHRYPDLQSTYSAHDRAHRFVTQRTPCTESVYDRARRFLTQRTPCTWSAHGHARRLMPHRTPCTESADGRACRFLYLRNICSSIAVDRADTCL